MLKVIKRVIFGSLSVLIVSTLFLSIALLNPSMTYANKTSFDKVTVYHNQALEKENPISAAKVANKILSTVDLLLDHPLLGKAGRIHKTRELVIAGTPYTVVYLAEFEVITLLRIFHQKQSWETL